MAMVVILGTAGIVYSRDQHQPDNSRPLAAAAGRAGDHWHAALGFDICGTFAPSVPDSGTDPLGIHTHGDGVVHIHPFSALASGKRAKLSTYFDTTHVKVTASSVKLPTEEPTHKNGQKCEAGPARVQMKVWDSRDPADQGRLVAGDPSSFRPKDGMLVTIAFVPVGADIPRPPSAEKLDKLTDVGPQPTDPTTNTTAPADSPTSSSTPPDPNAPPTVAAPTTTAPTSTTAATPPVAAGSTTTQP